MAIKHISGIGNLGKDPQLRYTQNGTAVCEYSLGATASRQNQNGEWEDDGTPLWLSLTFWGGRSRTLRPRRQARADHRVPRNRAKTRPLEQPGRARRNHLPGAKTGNTNQTTQEPTRATRRQRAGAMGRAYRQPVGTTTHATHPASPGATTRRPVGNQQQRQQPAILNRKKPQK